VTDCGASFVIRSTANARVAAVVSGGVRDVMGLENEYDTVVPNSDTSEHADALGCKILVLTVVINEAPHSDR
jgi:predicted methyltransferase MtxX (methanogen marker protein 4)